MRGSSASCRKGKYRPRVLDRTSDGGDVGICGKVQVERQDEDDGTRSTKVEVEVKVEEDGDEEIGSRRQGNRKRAKGGDDEPRARTDEVRK
jgi:hypothetical protein